VAGLPQGRHPASRWALAILMSLAERLKYSASE
jgi:hypothetical protein